ncbi:alpha/beta hydrolase [Intrasporangium sp.]|uniref:alpha/beta fold hydrolase n=1 Tax=Intrasporangium sp. TaxID=1925024 RepID=UPI002939A422|nr:alpha/beta hydrolase [Intrasporangium sp.]MDV3221081.1 alpha/beta hydrolase [Intrasporangium sp.]
MKRLSVPDGHIAYAEAGSGRPPIVLLHAGYVDHRMWDRELAHLSHRTRAVAPDARAHGQSSTPLSAFRQCDDVAALVRHLEAGPAVLVGVSMGAGAAVDTALEHPDVVRALVISGAGTNEPTFEDPWALALVQRQQQAIVAEDPASWLEATLEYVAGPSRSLNDVDPDVVERIRDMHEAFVRDHVRPGIVPPTHVVGSWDRLAEITVPVLGIVGELDSTDHHHMCERAVASVVDGRGVVRLPDCGHFPNLERPDDWERVVDDFLDELGVPTREETSRAH